MTAFEPPSNLANSHLNSTGRPRMELDRATNLSGALRSMTTQLNKIYAIKTIALVAQEIGEDEEWLSEIIEEMEPEDGLIWVYGPDGEGTAAFSDFGVENLENIIRERRRLKK